MTESLKEYTVHINGVPHTMQLTESDARARGLLTPEVETVNETAESPEVAAAEPKAQTSARSRRG